MPEETKLTVVDEDWNPPEKKPPDAPALTAATESDLVQTMVVTDKSGNRFDVAINAVANRAKGQILVTKVRDIYEMMVDDVLSKGVIPEPKDMKLIAETGALISGWSEEAYGASKLGGKTTDALERIAFAAAAGGAAGGSRGSYTDRLKKIQQIGKKQKKVVPLDADGKKQKS